MEGKALVDYPESASLKSIQKIADKIIEFDNK
jgi:hypothetical protein